MCVSLIHPCSNDVFSWQCRSQVFEWISGRFRLDHTFESQRATDITFLSLGPYLLLTSETTGLSILTRDESGRFSSNLSLPLQRPTKVERIGDDSGSVFVITNGQGPAQMFFFTENNISPFAITVSKSEILKHNVKLLC